MTQVAAPPLHPASTELITHLDADSFKKVCGKANQAVVYGTASCRYIDFRAAMKRQGEGFPIKKVFDCGLAYLENPWDSDYVAEKKAEKSTTLENRKMNQIPPTPGTIRAICKTTLVDVVLENVKRQEEGLEPIPVLFCIDIDGNKDPMLPESVPSKEPELNEFITHAEIRRAYKLMTHEDPRVRSAAEATFRFVKVKRLKEQTFGIEELPPLWQHASFKSAWEKRMAAKGPKKEKIFSWRADLKDRIQQYLQWRREMQAGVEEKEKDQDEGEKS